MATDIITEHELRKYIFAPKKALTEKDIKKFQPAGCLGIERLAQKELLAHIYPRIDPLFLAIKHPKIYDPKPKDDYSFHFTLPQFCIYSLDSPICEVKMKVTIEFKKFTDFNSVLKQPEVPKILRKPFLRSIELKDWRADESYCTHTLEYGLSEQFKGFVPEDAKSRIREAKQHFGNNQYIIAEANNWEGHLVPTNDPLIIGVYDEECYLVTHFNCTNLEDYVRREFKR